MSKIEIYEKCPESGGPVDWAWDIESGVAWQVCICGWQSDSLNIEEMAEALAAAERRSKIAEEAEK